jgi:hypothetical protein
MTTRLAADLKQAEKRKAYDRERQAEKRAAEKASKAASTRHPPTSADSADIPGHPPDIRTAPYIHAERITFLG